MKTFFLALFLGITIGSLVTAYIRTPESFDDLIAKTRAPSSEVKPEPVTPSQAEEPDPKQSPPAKPEEKPTFKVNASEIAEATKEKGALALREGNDLSIGTRIRGKLKLAKNIDSAAIEIDVEQGSVTLSGTVPDRSTMEDIITIAAETKGVAEVISKLEIDSNN